MQQIKNVLYQDFYKYQSSAVDLGPNIALIKRRFSHFNIDAHGRAGYGCASDLNNRALAKLADVRQVQKVQRAQNFSIRNVNEDLSIGTKMQLPIGIELCKISKISPNQEGKFMALSAPDLLHYMRDNHVNFMSFCFSDFNGKMHRMTYHTSALSANIFEQGIGFDGSSIQAWKDVHNSDCLMLPDLNTLFEDPFSTQKSMMMLCDIIDPTTGEGYLRDPRTVAKKAQQYLLDSGIAKSVNIGPEMEFFIFDAVEYENKPNEGRYQISASELGHNELSGHRPAHKGGYCPAQPIDHLFDIRAEICSALHSVGMSPSMQHHEVAAAQCEIGFKYSSLLNSADNVQKFKYIAKNVAGSFGKTATFMPKPIMGDNGSGMHTHFSLINGEGNVFFNPEGYAQLSDIGLFFIGGIIKYGRALNAFTNPTTNSYKRLVPGYEAPVNLAYAASNRSAAIRIPYSTGAAAKRVELRFPDPSCNPYLAFAAMLMAGLEGIEKQIHPGDAADANLYLIDNRHRSTQLSTSLTEALEHLDADRAFLLKGVVFTDDLIDAYIAHKRQEVMLIEQQPNPMEFQLYYAT